MMEKLEVHQEELFSRLNQVLSALESFSSPLLRQK